MHRANMMITLLLSCLLVHAQEPGEEKERIRTIRSYIAAKECFDVQAVTNFNGKTEFWSFATLGDTVQSFWVWSYMDSYLYREYYLIENGNLILGLEEELFIPYNHTVQGRWNCLYYVKDESVFDYISLGHGKTEDDNWNPDEIIVQFQKRMMQQQEIKGGL